MVDDITPRGGLGRFFAKVAGVFALLLLASFAALWLVQSYIRAKVDPDPVTIASGSLAGLREQNRLSAFQARYVAVVTSKQSRFGLSTERTIIMPGTVDYAVDLARLTQRDVTWDAKTRTLGVTLPPVEVSPPAIDLGAIREYGANGLLGTFTDATHQLDEVNRAAGQKELVHQAIQPAPMKLARDATRRAVEQSFAMPLRAAGIDASVKVRFAGEGGDGELWDTTRSLAEVLANRR